MNQSNEDTFSIIIIKNLDTSTPRLSYEQINKMRNIVNSFPDSQDGLMIKFAFSNAIVEAQAQVTKT